MPDRKLPVLWLECESLDSVIKAGRGHVWAVVADDTPQHMVERYEPERPRCRTCAHYVVDGASTERDLCVAPRVLGNSSAPTVTAKDGVGYCHQHSELRNG